MQSPYSIGIDHTHDQSQSCTHWHCESIMLRGKKSIVAIIIQAKSDIMHNPVTAKLANCIEYK